MPANMLIILTINNYYLLFLVKSNLHAPVNLLTVYESTPFTGDLTRLKPTWTEEHT